MIAVLCILALVTALAFLAAVAIDLGHAEKERTERLRSLESRFGLRVQLAERLTNAKIETADAMLARGEINRARRDAIVENAAEDFRRASEASITARIQLLTDMRPRPVEEIAELEADLAKLRAQGASRG